MKIAILAAALVASAVPAGAVTQTVEASFDLRRFAAINGNDNAYLVPDAVTRSGSATVGDGETITLDYRFRGGALRAVGPMYVGVFLKLPLPTPPHNDFVSGSVTFLGTAGQTLMTLPKSNLFCCNTIGLNEYAPAGTRVGGVRATFTVTSYNPARRGDIPWFMVAGGYEVAAVPEPGVWISLLTGFAAVGAALRRRRMAVAG